MIIHVFAIQRTVTSEIPRVLIPLGRKVWYFDD